MTRAQQQAMRSAGALKGLRLAGALRKVAELCLTCGKPLDDGQDHTRCRGAA